MHPQKEYAAERQKKTAGRQERAAGKQRKSCLVMRGGAVEGRLDNWGEVVTR